MTVAGGDSENENEDLASNHIEDTWKEEKEYKAGDDPLWLMPHQQEVNVSND